MVVLCPDPGELSSISARLEHQDAPAIVAWTWEHFGTSAVLTSSFEDPVLIDIVASVAPQLEILFLDTQYHFAETLSYVKELERRYSLNCSVVHPSADVVPDDLWKSDVEACCHSRKVEPLRRALEGRRAWITGIRRADGPSRASVPIVSFDETHQLVKVNPLATWPDAQMTTYQADRELPAHPLFHKGYRSIGCWPCTRPVALGEDRRAGRWAGLDKTECGLHR